MVAQDHGRSKPAFRALLKMKHSTPCILLLLRRAMMEVPLCRGTASGAMQWATMATLIAGQPIYFIALCYILGH